MLNPIQTLIRDGIISRVNNLDTTQEIKTALVAQVHDVFNWHDQNDSEVCIYEKNGLISTGVGWDETYIIWLQTHGFANISYSEFNKLDNDVQENILERTEYAKAYWSIFTE